MGRLGLSSDEWVYTTHPFILSSKRMPTAKKRIRMKEENLNNEINENVRILGFCQENTSQLSILIKNTTF